MRMIVAGGGTGGHVFPGIGLLRRFLSLCPGGVVSFVRHPRGGWSARRPGPGDPDRFRPSGQVRGGRAGRPGAARMAWECSPPVAVVRRRRPDLVSGVGGYASVPWRGGASAPRAPVPAGAEQRAGTVEPVSRPGGPCGCSRDFRGGVFFRRGGGVHREPGAGGDRGRAGSGAAGSRPGRPSRAGPGGSAGARRSTSGCWNGPPGETGRKGDAVPAADGPRKSTARSRKRSARRSSGGAVPVHGADRRRVPAVPRRADARGALSIAEAALFGRPAS